ncbi:hypothetical protein Z043-120032 [Arapaima gigas]
MEKVKVKVAVRMRPLLSKEVQLNRPVCVQALPNTAQVVLGQERTFTFDYVFGPKTKADEVYTSCVKPLVSSLLNGHNVTVFTYGKTGSGKTFTIGGGHGDRGIIPHVVQDIFQGIAEKYHSDFKVKASYIEIYKEKLRDLLNLETQSKNIHIREDDKGNTVLVGARENTVDTADELLGVLEAGNTARHIAATQVNETSSRSHTIFTVALTQRDSEANLTLFSKLNVVDLAGSERVAQTGNKGQLLKESAQINSGLLALGNVLRALSQPHRRGQYVPYRSSKITRLLRDSLGGNSQTLMITCISPSSSSLHETLRSLQFASCARTIHNQLVVNWDKGMERVGEPELEESALQEPVWNQGGDSQVSQDKCEQSQAKGRALEEKIARQQQKLLQFRNFMEHAAHLLMELRDSLDPTLSPTQSLHVQKLQETNTEMPNQKSIYQPSSCKGAGEDSHHITILQLRLELRKCQEALAMNEQILSQKEAQLQQLQGQVDRLEQEKRVQRRALLEDRDSMLMHPKP